LRSRRESRGRPWREESTIRAKPPEGGAEVEKTARLIRMKVRVMRKAPGPELRE